MLFNNKTQENDKSKKRITIYGYLYPSAGVTCLVRFDILWICCHKKLQKGLWLFRASPFVSVCVVHYLESSLSDIPRHPQPRLPGGRLKSRKCKKSAFGGKKSPATPVQKMITLFYIGRCQTDGITQSAVFLPPKAAFLNGQKPLFELCRLLSSCKAWRWGWWRRQRGKRVFRLASPTATKRRSRQQPPWLFVFISTTNRSN